MPRVNSRSDNPSNADAIRVTRLFVHPIKGVAPVEVSRWDVDEFGLRDDRRWMIVARDGLFLSQRNVPRLALIRAEFADSGLLLRAPDVADLFLPDAVVRPANGDRMRVTVWNDSVRSRIVEGGASEWLSRVLGRTCSLCWMPREDTPLRVLPRAANPIIQRDRPVSFADAFPFLLITMEAVTQLNARIAAKPDGEKPNIIVQRFRPNIVITNAPAHAEDGWRRIRIGAIPFLVSKPCARCAVPTVDPETAVRGTEPTRTLAQYRLHDGQVWFGQNLVHESTGRLSVGDVVEVDDFADQANPPIGISAGGIRGAADRLDR